MEILVDLEKYKTECGEKYNIPEQDLRDILAEMREISETVQKAEKKDEKKDEKKKRKASPYMLLLMKTARY